MPKKPIMSKKKLNNAEVIHGLLLLQRKTFDAANALEAANESKEAVQALTEKWAYLSKILILLTGKEPEKLAELHADMNSWIEIAQAKMTKEGKFLSKPWNTLGYE